MGRIVLGFPPYVSEAHDVAIDAARLWIMAYTGGFPHVTCTTY